VKRVAVSDVQANTGSEFTVINVEEKDRLQLGAAHAAAARK
jgi:hypothetical protein